MLNQNQIKKQFIDSVAYTVLSAISLIFGVICTVALSSSADPMDTSGNLAVMGASFVVYILFILFSASGIVLSMFGAGFSIPLIKWNYKKKQI